MHPSFDPSSIDLHGKYVLITGASNGLGRAVALDVAKSGGHVIALGRDLASLTSLDDEINDFGGKATLIPSDLQDADLWGQLPSILFDKFGKLDAIFGNAAILGELTPITDIDEKTWSNVFDINLGANFRLLKTLYPLLRQSEDPHIAFVTSSVANTCPPYWASYAISKAALEAMAKIAAKEFLPSSSEWGIKINIFDPGGMATKMREKAMPGEDQSLLPKASDVSIYALYLLSNQCTDTGKTFIYSKWKEENK